MPYTLAELADDIRTSLNDAPIDDSAPQICAAVSRALNDDAFIAEHLADRPAGSGPREIIFEDPDLGFCICAHIYEGEAVGKPHDHGSSWAIYGQAVGVTEMNDWHIVEPGDGDKPALVEHARTYRMERGDAHFYNVGDVHSPTRHAPTRLIRIEGANLDNVTRSKIAAIEPATG